MWTTKNHGRYDRSTLRYPSDLTDDEWSLVGPLIPHAKRGGNKRTVDIRSTVCITRSTSNAANGRDVSQPRPLRSSTVRAARVPKKGASRPKRL